MSDPDIKWFTICQVADMLQISEDYLRSLAKTGKIHAVKLPGGKNAPVRISEESVSRFLASCQIESSFPKPDHNEQNVPRKSPNRRRRSASAASWGV